jgi:4-amino-4-deoxy-L-arabinose transferase-like glycosyltransferase
LGPLLNPPQFAPVGFVLLSKVLTLAFPENELTLRLIPLISGILSVFLFVMICKKLLDQKSLLLAALLFSISEYLIQYSAEFKQYSSDVFLTLLLVYMVLRIEEEGYGSNKIISILTFALIGIISLFFSYPVILILCTAGCYLIYSLFKAGQKKLVFIITTVSVVWLCTFLLNYKLFVIDSPAFDEGLRDFWQGGFLAFPPFSAKDIRQYFEIVKEVFGNNPLKLFYPGLIFFGFLYGCMSGSLSKDRRFILVFAPIILTIILSILGKYPIKGRMILFLSPFLIIFISVGFSRLFEIIAKDSKAIAIALILIIFLQPVIYQIYRIKTPKMGEEIKEVLKYYKANRANDNRLYVYYGGQDAFQFYKKRFEIDNTEYILGNSGREHWQTYNEDINKLKGKGRVWFLFSHVIDWHGVNEEKYFIHILNNVGTKIKTHQVYGASIYLYDL